MESYRAFIANIEQEIEGNKASENKFARAERQINEVCEILDRGIQSPTEARSLLAKVYLIAENAPNEKTRLKAEELINDIEIRYPELRD